MGIWTQADIDKLRAAVVALASGEAVQTVRYDGPPSRTVTYQPADLEKMSKLLSAMVSDVAATGGRSGYLLAATRKGF